MKRPGLVLAVGFLLLGTRCNKPTRPPEPPSGWVVPLVAPDSGGQRLLIDNVLFAPQKMVLMGTLLDSFQIVGSFLGQISYDGAWQGFHAFAQGPNDYRWLFPVGDRVVALPWHAGFPCTAFFLNMDGTIDQTLSVVDPEGYDCWIVDVMPHGNGYFVAGTSDMFNDTLSLFLASLESGGGGIHQVWFRRYQRGSNAANFGGLLLPSSEGIALLGVTSEDLNWRTDDSLWLLKLTGSGQVVAETTLDEGWSNALVRRTDTLMVLGYSSWNDTLPNLLLFDLRTFRVLWRREHVPYVAVDAPPTGPFAGAIVRDSSMLRYVQLSFQTGAEFSSRDLWEGVTALYFFRMGPRGFLLEFPVLGTGFINHVLAYVPYGGRLPALPDSGSTGVQMASPCPPVSRLTFLWHRNPRDRRLCGRER